MPRRRVRCPDQATNIVEEGMQRIHFTRLLAAGTLLAGTAACGGSQQAAGGALPGGATPSIAHPMAAATPPVTAPVTIPYPYTNTWKTTTWSGPSAKPKTKPGSESGKIVVEIYRSIRRPASTSFRRRSIRTPDTPKSSTRRLRSRPIRRAPRRSFFRITLATFKVRTRRPDSIRIRKPRIRSTFR